MTFYRADAKLPDFEDYSMQGRTYRYYEEKPLYPFGHGLSYGAFSYSQLSLDKGVAQASDDIYVRLLLENRGKMTAVEVVQLYVRPLKRDKLDARHNLRGFQAVELQPGETREVRFQLVGARDFSYYDEQQRAYRTRPGKYEIQVGSSSADIRVQRNIEIR